MLYPICCPRWRTSNHKNSHFAEKWLVEKIHSYRFVLDKIYELYIYYICYFTLKIPSQGLWSSPFPIFWSTSWKQFFFLVNLEILNIYIYKWVRSAHKWCGSLKMTEVNMKSLKYQNINQKRCRYNTCHH